MLIARQTTNKKPKSKKMTANDIRDVEIQDLQDKVKKLEEIVSELSQAFNKNNNCYDY